MEEIKTVSVLIIIPILLGCATVAGVGATTKTPEEFKEYFKKYTPIMIVFYFIMFLILYYVKH